MPIHKFLAEYFFQFQIKIKIHVSGKPEQSQTKAACVKLESEISFEISPSQKSLHPICLLNCMTDLLIRVFYDNFS